MRHNQYAVEDVKNAIKNSRSWRQVTEKVGLKYAGGNVRTLKNIASKYSFDFSHFLGRGWNIGGEALNTLSFEDVFRDDSKCNSQYNLKRHVLKRELIEYKCSKCNLGNIWNDEEIILHLDHINGNKKDNRIENLRFLCPNCHSQTKTYCRSSATKNPKFYCKKCGKELWHKNQSNICMKCK